MEVPANVLEVLKCSSCSTYLSRGPVYLQHNGDATCGRCFAPKRATGTRNTQYEAMVALLLFPCKYRELGCRETVPFAAETEVLAHEEVCEHRQYVCPVLGSARCSWLGPRSAMLAHCRVQHPGSVLESPCSLSHDISKPSLHNYIITAFHLLFLLHTKVCVTTGRIYHALRLLGGSADAANYHYTVDIKRNEELISKKGQVAPQGCLAIQEDTALALDTNSILGVLGGFDGTTFTLTVKRRVSDAAEQLPTTRNVSERCKNQGCSYTDIPSKNEKHAMYFCSLSSLCVLCRKTVLNGSLPEHYSLEHRNITLRAGFTWRVRQAESLCLMSSVAGTAVCCYKLQDTQFEIKVSIPVVSGRLREYRCVITLTLPTTGYTRTYLNPIITRTYTPDVLYDECCDWHIRVKKEEFPFWKTQFNVSIDINKASISNLTNFLL